MEQYKKDFIDFLLKTGALKVFENSSDDRSLKSKRLSPWFVNISDFNDGESSGALADFYADAVINSGVDADILYGIPDKGVSFVSPVAIAMARKGKNVSWCFSRKDEKTHGEATNLAPADRAKKLLVGRIPKQGQSICQLDDVFTAGTAKYEANTFLNSVGNFNLPLLVIGVDRQEVAVDTRDAIQEYEEKTRTKVASIVNAVDVYSYLKEKKLVSGKALERLSNYLRVYGTDSAREFIKENVGKLEQRIIERDRSVLPACDVSRIEKLEELFKKTADVEGIGSYKIGFEPVLSNGLKPVADKKRKSKPLLYNHQGGATDIPDVGDKFMTCCKQGGVDGVILSFLSGPKTAESWIKAAKENGLDIIAESYLGHNGFIQEDGGFISWNSLLRMHKFLIDKGVNKFILPAIEKDTSKEKRERIVRLEKYLSELGVSSIFYRPYNGKVEGSFDEIVATEVMEVGLPFVVETARKYTNKPIIYDHQKAGTYIPDTGKNFVMVCKKAGVDAAILFPQAGPETERAWIYHALDQDLKVIVGGPMTHSAYAVSEGGFISDEGALEICRIAARAGINNFVVPGNKPEVIKKVRGVIEAEGVSAVYYGPGLGIGQGGDTLKAKEAAGNKFHAIVGRGIYQAEDMKKAALEHTSQL